VRNALRRIGATLLLATAATAVAAQAANAQISTPGTGPGGPVLVVSDSANPFGSYYAEILRAEGLNEFAVRDVDTLTPALLSAYQVVVLSDTAVTSAQVSALTSWVNDGGNLIAMRPRQALAPLLGLGGDGGNLDNGYVTISQSGPGAGITAAAMQFHGQADVRAVAAGTQQVASLSSGGAAVTLRSVGSSGGQAAAFMYDLARSVVYTRQGNPDQVGANVSNPDESDSIVRSNDLFQPNWLDVSKVRIPQADEQQRLLANLIIQMNLDRAPLPRFWYLPRGDEAAVVMTGDDHAQASPSGTSGQFQRFENESPGNCSVADWECVRATSYLFPGAVVPNATTFQSAGFEIALHLSTNCENYTTASLSSSWDNQLADFTRVYPGIASPRTSRTHCIVWSDWLGEPTAERARGVRLDTNYYYYPASWALSRPGLFTGSGFPMRFADTDGTPIDVYQAATQIVDEWGDRSSGWPSAGVHIRALLDAALGAEGYYGVVTANMHTDESNHAGANQIVAEALDRGVPVVSAAQMLDWLDGRDGSAFEGVSYSGNRLQFTVDRGATARGLQGMVPARNPNGPIISFARNGVAVSAPIRRVKGIDYAIFDAQDGTYSVTYGGAGVLAPDTTITQASVSGNRATFGFTGRDAAAFQCRLDGAAFAACGNPRQYTGLSRGGHAFQVRAISPSGTPDPTPAEYRFTVKASATVSGTVRDRRVKLAPRRVRASESGRVRLRVLCPEEAGQCKVKLRLKADGRLLASRTLTVAGGETRSIRMKLRRSARRMLLQEGALRATATAVSRDAAGTRTVTRKTVRLLAPESGAGK